jgi:hypothetical protein
MVSSWTAAAADEMIAQAQAQIISNLIMADN